MAGGKRLGQGSDYGSGQGTGQDADGGFDRRSVQGFDQENDHGSDHGAAMARRGAATTEDQLLACLKNVDALFTSTVMSAAAMIPGVAGIAAAGATVGFDLSKRFWMGAILSGTSMIPIAGYLMGGAKIAWNIRCVREELEKIEGFLPKIEKSPSLIAQVEQASDKHLEQIRHIPFAKPLMARLERIIAACREMEE